MAVCRVYRLASIAVLAASIAYTVALLLADEKTSIILLKAWIAAATIALGWLGHRLLWFQCRPPSRSSRLGDVGRLPPG